MLNDMHINYSQTSLKLQFPTVDGLHSTILQSRALENKIEQGLQIVPCRGNHWILATNLSCDVGIRRVYDSVYSTIDQETINTQRCMFNFTRIDMEIFQKQNGGTDYGLFAIAAGTALLYQQDVSSIVFNQEEMRSHLCCCIETELTD